MWCVSGATPAAVAAAASRSAPLRGPAPLPALALMGTTTSHRQRHRSRQQRHQNAAASSSAVASSSIAAAGVSAETPALAAVGAAAALASTASGTSARKQQKLQLPLELPPVQLHHDDDTLQQLQQLQHQHRHRHQHHHHHRHQHRHQHQLPRHPPRLSSATARNAPSSVSPVSFSSASSHSLSPLLVAHHQPRRVSSQQHYNYYQHHPRLQRHLGHHLEQHHNRRHLVRHDAAAIVARCVLVDLAPVRCRLRSLAMGSASQQTRAHIGHGHGHGHHHHDNSYLLSANKNDSGVRITRIGLLSNLGMAVAKFIGGWAFNSKAMTADAWHSIADLASDILTLATISWSLKSPSDRFPLGFGKVESLGSLGVSGMLLSGGLYMGWESALSLFGHFNPEAARELLEHVGHGHGHGHSHSAASLGIPSIHAAWLAAGTILIKEWLYHATMKVARERRSSVLASNAVHHRVDSLTGIVTLAAILGANVLESAAWLDPVGGLLISIMVVKAGLQNTKSALYELTDQSIDGEVKGSIRKQAQRALANVSEGHVAELRDVSGVKSGQNFLVDLEMAVPGAWTVDEMRTLEDQVRTQVGGTVRGVRRVRVRFVSRDGAVKEKFDDFIPSSVQVEADPEPRENGEAKGTATGHDNRH
ncbi:hypothetical protein G6O67_002219 [Ophiocordyceps sinensis]|uniref:Cation efflux protein transmembrane domain-containing protein n=1 Tax=Ophiocordyceps sinensis TaxID=72228 RepID=A0A8H4PTQ3_9HYPO|nr:hypothetical protein G6O67_002219 [Ophiocordyceps sinensis]